MKKYLHPKYLPILVPIAAVLGLLLRLWTMAGGPDEDGLYPSHAFAWVLLWIVTLITLGGIILLTRGFKKAGRYFDNFPASPIGAAGCAASALGVMYTGLSTLTRAADLLGTLTGLLGIAAAVALVLTAFGRYKGKKNSFVLHAIPCLFFALRIFDRCKAWSNVTQTSVFLFQFLASVCIMLATYQLCCYDVSIGNRKSSLLWSLSATYFCVLALPMGDDTLFYIGTALWLMTNLCSVRAIKTPKVPEVPQSAPEQTEVAPAAEEAPQGNASYEELLNWLDKE